MAELRPFDPFARRYATLNAPYVMQGDGAPEAVFMHPEVQRDPESGATELFGTGMEVVGNGSSQLGLFAVRHSGVVVEGPKSGGLVVVHDGEEKTLVPYEWHNPGGTDYALVVNGRDQEVPEEVIVS